MFQSHMNVFGPVNARRAPLSGLWFTVLVGALLWAPAFGAGAQSVDPSFRQALDRVDSLRTAREFRSALARLDELSRMHPNHVEVLWRQSILWSDLGKAATSESRALGFYRQAHAVAENAVSADPNHAWAHVAKAVAAGRLAKVTSSTKKSIQLSREVKEHADRAIELDDSLGAAYHVRGRWHREIATLTMVQRLIVKTVYGGLPVASMEQSVEDFRTAIQLENRSYHHLELGKTYEVMGRTDAARAALEAALDAPWADPFDADYKREARERLIWLK